MTFLYLPSSFALVTSRTLSLNLEKAKQEAVIKVEGSRHSMTKFSIPFQCCPLPTLPRAVRCWLMKPKFRTLSKKWVSVRKGLWARLEWKAHYSKTSQAEQYSFPHWEVNVWFESLWNLYDFPFSTCTLHSVQVEAHTTRHSAPPNQSACSTLIHAHRYLSPLTLKVL